MRNEKRIQRWKKKNIEIYKRPVLYQSRISIIITNLLSLQFENLTVAKKKTAKKKKKTQTSMIHFWSPNKRPSSNIVSLGSNSSRQTIHLTIVFFFVIHWRLWNTNSLQPPSSLSSAAETASETVLNRFEQEDRGRRRRL